LLNKVKKFHYDSWKDKDDETHHNLYHFYRNKSRKAERDACRYDKRQELLKLNKTYKGNMRKFWKMVNQIKKKKVEINIPIEDLERVYKEISTQSWSLVIL
jgi:hypothetical protein